MKRSKFLSERLAADAKRHFDNSPAAVCKTHNRKCIIADESEEFIAIAEKRLGVKRLALDVVDTSLSFVFTDRESR